jgi:tRNA (5-methylaminomethyl-2-thiouridylate)-methyltransferase
VYEHLKTSAIISMPTMAAALQRLVSRAVSAVASPSAATGNVVHLALSGGVDSSVAGFLLRERGWDVRPVLLRCWADADDDSGGCFAREERLASKSVFALKLKRNLAVFDFVSEYWTDVFDGVLLSGLAAGTTPNQDLACNAAIKFGAFPERLAAEAGGVTPPFATGHYARLETSGDAAAPSKPRLLRAVDPVKDQSYFLASVPGSALQTAMFPIGGLYKTEVREIAAHAGLPSATEKSSRGICFVGKRGMADFTARYLTSKPRERGSNGTGSFLTRSHGSDDEFDAVAKLRQPAHLYTLGQRARIGGVRDALYVVGRRGADVVVSPTRLAASFVECDIPSWISGEVPSESQRTRLEYKACSTEDTDLCDLVVHDSGRVRINFGTRRDAIAPGQAVVLFRGEQVLGAALVSGTL